MRPNLASFRARSVEFWCHLDLETTEFDRLTSAFPDDKNYRELPWLFADSYSLRKARHFASAVVTAPKGKTKAIHVHFEFSRQPVLPADLQAKPLSDLVGLASERALEGAFDCTVTLEYPEKGWRSLVSLPMRLLEYRDLPFDEFRGFRAVKVQEGKTAYSVIIDRAENKAILHLVQFSYSGPVDSKLGDTILKEGARISSLFIHREES